MHNTLHTITINSDNIRNKNYFTNNSIMCMKVVLKKFKFSHRSIDIWKIINFDKHGWRRKNTSLQSNNFNRLF